MRLPNLFLSLCSLLNALLMGHFAWCAEATRQDSHPLMPSLRSPDLNSVAWPRTLHDNLASGFSPLTCGMSTAPRIASTVELGGHANRYTVHQQVDGTRCFIVDDGLIHCWDEAGHERWRGPWGGMTLVHFGPLHGSASVPSPERLVFAGGPRVVVLDAASGQLVWSHEFNPPHASVRAVVQDILPDLPGLEMAVVLAHAEEGALFQFPPQGEPKRLWQTTIIIPGEHPERHDHGCELLVDLSHPAEPWLWNIRRFRCHGIDARSGKLRSTLAYPVGGEHRRNYGPSALGQAADGTPILAVASENVQLHVHALRLHRHAPSELAWDHFYGEVYKQAFGVALQALRIADLDHDGETEMLYSVRDPAHEFRSFVRLRSAATGEIEWELPDHWGLAVYEQTPDERSSLVVTCRDPDRAMARRGELHVFRIQAGQPPQEQGVLSASELIAPPSTSDPWPLVVRKHNPIDGHAHLERYRCVSSPPFLQLIDECHASGLPQGSSHLPWEAHDGAFRWLFTEPNGHLALANWSGAAPEWSHPLAGGPYPSLAAVDRDADGSAELLAVTPQRQLRVTQFPSLDRPQTVQSFPYVARWDPQSPLAYDLEQTGKPCLILPIARDDGQLAVRAVRGDGSTLWTSPPLGVQVDELESFVAMGGRFLPNARPAIAVSLRDQRITREGTYLLDGATGEIHWFKDLYNRNGIVMPYRAHGIPTVADIDGDGDEELGIDMLSYMAYLHGEDGSFARLHHTKNIALADSTYAGHLYNTFLPVFGPPVNDHSDTTRYWFAKGGFGPFGVMDDAIHSGRWKVDFDYDVPSNVGLIDVDGDGRLEVGYAAGNHSEFVCRDFWTGEIEWTLSLPYPPNAPCLSADVDGDRRGDFLIGSFCVGTDSKGHGAIKWQSPVPIGWGIIADLDGDGQGEIACPGLGKVTILRGN